MAWVGQVLSLLKVYTDIVNIFWIDHWAFRFSHCLFCVTSFVVFTMMLFNDLVMNLLYIIVNLHVDVLIIIIIVFTVTW